MSTTGSIPGEAPYPAARHGRTRPTNRRRKPAIAFPTRYRKHPTAIRQAIYRAWESAEQIGGTKSTIAVLQAIVSCVSLKDPFATVFAKKAKLAAIADTSEASVYRALKQLVDNGWIEKLDQYRHVDGTLDVTEICITPKLADILMLVAVDKRQHESSAHMLVEATTSNNGSEALSENLPFDAHQGFDDPISPGKDLSDSTQKAMPDRPLSIDADDGSRDEPTPLRAEEPAKMSDGLRDGSIYRVDLTKVYPRTSVNHQSAGPRFVRMDGRSVPAELAWLITEKRMTYSGLFALMPLAKKVSGQQLTDFVALRKDRIRQLETTSDCYRYLKSLIDQQLDARFLCKQQSVARHRVKRTEQRTEAAKHRESWIRRHDGRVFLGTDGTTTFCVNAANQKLIVGNLGKPTNRPCVPVGGAFIQAVESGRIKPFVAIDDRLTKEQGRARVADLWKILKNGD